MSGTEDLLRVYEVFYSLQGESRSSGRPTVFIRLTGCPLRCRWCDTAYAFQGGTLVDMTSLIEQTARYGTDYVCLTGGEPLAQPLSRPLLQKLCDRFDHVSLETSGALSIANIDPRVSIVMDWKAPGSDESRRNMQENIEWLRPCDQVKFVLSSKADFDWACFEADRHNFFDRVSDVLISPVWGEVEAADLAEWVLSSRRPWRMQLQLHKLLWNDTPGR